MISPTKSPSRPTLGRSFQKIWQKTLKYWHTNRQCFTQTPRLFWLSKLSRFEAVRDLVCYFSQSPSRLDYINNAEASAFENLDIDRVVDSLRTGGVYLGLNLPPALQQKILKYAYTTPCFADRGRQVKFSYHQKQETEAELGQQIEIGCYAGEDYPTVFGLATDPGLLAIAAKYLGAAPVYVASELMWSFPYSATWQQKLKQAQVLHYDLDDYRSIKFFFYITPVSATTGAHVCVQGSHRNKKLKHQILGQRCASIPDEKLIREYGPENVLTICGPAGFGFVEDTCCFHKGTLPETGERLMLQLEFALNSYDNLRELNTERLREMDRRRAASGN